MESTTSEPALTIGALVFPGIDQADLTGPFEVLSRLPGARFHLLWKETGPLRDTKGLLLTPEMTLAAAPPLDLLVVPGGYGVNPLMTDPVVLDFLRARVPQARWTLSVCTGALLLGAAGLLAGRRATTHWASHGLLAAFGALPADGRVVVDGNLVSAAGVTSGIDGALRLAALVAGERIAEEIQLALEYAPEPPFAGGSPATATPEVLARVTEQLRPVVEERRRIVAAITGPVKTSSASADVRRRA